MPQSPADPPSAALLTALGLPEGATATRAPGGSDAPVWRLDAAGLRYALRLRPAFAAPATLREVAAMQAAGLGGLPVPEVLRAETIDDVSCLLTTWSPGETLAAALLEHGADPVPLGAACGRLMAQLHRLAAPAVLTASAGWLRSTAKEARLLAGVPDIERSHLLHLDFHPLNILTDGREVTGVIDWVNAGAGDPRQDLARTLAILRLVMPQMVPPASAAPIAALTEAWIAGYEEVAGRPYAMKPFLAWAGLRTVRDLSAKFPPGTLRVMEAEISRWVEDAAQA